jgi:hypothetical protein
MTITSNSRRLLLSAIWAIGGALILGDAIHELIELPNRKMDHHVRAYAEMANELIIAFGMLSLFQCAQYFIKARWAEIASRGISVFVLAITGFSLLMTVVTGTIGSLVPITGNAILLLGSLVSLLMKSNENFKNAT